MCNRRRDDWLRGVASKGNSSATLRLCVITADVWPGNIFDVSRCWINIGNVGLPTMCQGLEREEPCRSNRQTACARTAGYDESARLQYVYKTTDRRVKHWQGVDSVLAQRMLDTGTTSYTPPRQRYGISMTSIRYPIGICIGSRYKVDSAMTVRLLYVCITSIRSWKNIKLT